VPGLATHMHSSSPISHRSSSLAFLWLALPCLPISAQNPRSLNNGGEVVLNLGDPSVAGDLYWMVWPRQCLVSPSGSVEVSQVTFELYDTDWSTSAQFFDVVFGPGTTSPSGVIEPDFSPAALALSTTLVGGSSGFPNPCTASPGFCTSIGGTALCPPTGSVVGYNVDMILSACDGSGILLSANNTVDNVVTVLLPAGMSLVSGPSGPCGAGDYGYNGSTSIDEQQADTLATVPGASRYGGFQLGASPGFVPDAVNERSVYTLRFCEPMVNTTIAGDRGTVGLHLDATRGPWRLQQVVSDTVAGPIQVAFVSNSLFPPLPAPGLPFLGAGLLLDPSDPTFVAMLKSGPFQVLPFPPYPWIEKAFVPPAILAPAIPARTTLVLSSQGFNVNLATSTARATPLTQTRVNH
jgi:hypothetical protein